MRTLLLLLAIAAAGAGIWFTAFDNSASMPHGDEEDEGIQEERPSASPGAGLREIAESPLVDIASSDRDLTLLPLNSEDLLSTLLRLDPSTQGVNGEALLAVLKDQLGSRLPVRFASEATWRRFRDVVLMPSGTPIELDLRTMLDLLRDRGWEVGVAEAYRCVLIRPKRSP